MRWAAVVLVFVVACAGESEAAPVESEPCEPSVPQVVEPAEYSVAWLLLQPYGAACDDGARASDNIASTFIAHPGTGRCTYACEADDAPGSLPGLCAASQGRCDDMGLCVSVWEVR